MLRTSVIHITPSCFRVHPEVRYRGGSKRAGGRRGRLFFWELHVRLFGGWGSGHGVVVKGEILPPSPHNRLSFPKEQKLRTIFIFKQDNFLQQHEDFYCYTRICSMILQNINPYLGIHDHLPLLPPLYPDGACLDQRGVHHSSPWYVVAWVEAFTLLLWV